MRLTHILIVFALLILSAPYVDSPQANAQGTLPSSAEISKYLVVGMGDDADIDNAFQMSNTEIGADRDVLSNSEDVWPPNVTSSFPNIRDVFESRWDVGADPDRLNDHHQVFEGIDWSGNVALTSDNSSFDSDNSLVFADFGIGTAATKSQFGSVDSQSRYFEDGNSTTPVGLRTDGTSNNNDFSQLLTDLQSWKTFIDGLSAEATITKSDIESIFVNNSASNGNGGLRTTYADALDTNNDGIILVDVNTDGIDFSINNTDWVVNGTGNKLIIFRINNGANMLMSNASITLGAGGIDQLGAGMIFYHASESSNSSDEVFNGDNVILDGGAFWDLNDIGEASGGGSDGHNIVINNGQGCWQFISQKVNFQNNRWNKCAVGRTPAATISGEVFDDLDGDGVQDGVDPGVEDITVNLIDEDGTTVDTTQTNAVGTYTFPDVDPGTYTVQVVEPEGKDFSPQDQGGPEGSPDTADSDVDATGVTDPITVNDGDTIDDVDAGLVDEGNPSFTFVTTIEGQDANTLAEAVQAAVGDDLTFEYTVENTGDVPIEWTTLDDDVFGELTSTCQLPTIIPVGGNASCSITRPAEDAPTGKRNIGSVTIRNVGSANDPAWYITNPDNASLTGTVFNDAGQDGIQNPTDPGISGIQVNLVEPLGDVVASTVTSADDPNTPADETGDYQFVGVTANIPYRVEFVVPSPETFITLKDQGNDDTIDSDANPISGRTDLIAVEPGEVSENNDTGLYDFLQSKPATLGDKVWEDVDGDGVQDAGEPGVPDVTVQLLTPSGTVLQTTTTDSDGMYLFDGLIPDNYIVRFVLPNGFDAFTDQDAGIDETVDSDADPADGETDVITLGLSEVNPDVDAGIVRLVSVGDFVWEDLDADGIQDAGEPGIEGVTVELFEVGNTTPLDSTDTDSNGLYEFTDLQPGEYYVVFEQPAGFEFTDRDQGTDDAIDSDANPNSGPDTGATDSVVIPSGTDNDTLDAGVVRPGSIGDMVFADEDNDGIQDPGEEGVPDVVVNLLDENGNEIATTTTDPNGNYEFPVLPGTYIIEVETPNGFVLSPQDEGNDDAADSDPDPTTGQTNTIPVESGEDIDTVDAGLGGLGSIGDFVWSDTDGDGIQDPNEPGIDDVTVTLLDGDGNTVETTTTDNGGEYVFDNLPADDYQVVVEIPANFIVSPKDQGGPGGSPFRGRY